MLQQLKGVAPGSEQAGNQHFEQEGAFVKATTLPFAVVNRQVMAVKARLLACRHVVCNGDRQFLCGNPYLPPKLNLVVA